LQAVTIVTINSTVKTYIIKHFNDFKTLKYTQAHKQKNVTPEGNSYLNLSEQFSRSILRDNNKKDLGKKGSNLIVRYKR
jgi:hypothetical protein